MTLAIRGSEPKFYNLIRATVCGEQVLFGYRESEDSGRFPEVYDLVISCILSRNGQSQPVFSLGLIRSEAACIYKGTINIEISLMKLMVPMAFLFSLNNLLGLQTEIIQNIS